MKIQNQNGFTLVQAVFILVVLALIGAAMVRMLDVQTTTGVLALQQARAYHAARSGLEWGAARALADNDCNGSLTIENFDVDVECVATPVVEGSDSYQIFTLESLATFGVYGSAAYVSRKVQMKVGSYAME